MQADGRVIDHSSAERHTTSEGQAYAMFFALVANDRPVFDLLWQWTLNNLASEGLERHLPAWRWGRKPDGGWGVLDRNSASDADLWFAFSLLEAQRLWGDSSHGRHARVLLERVVRDEVVKLPRNGALLLPGTAGFALGQGTWRLNPSYSAFPILARFAEIQPDGPWSDIATNSLHLIETQSPQGFVPDWALYHSQTGFMVDPQLGSAGSYDAIRVYLWVGMLDSNDRMRSRLLRSLGGMARSLRRSGSVPERVQTPSGKGVGTAPAGFHAALLPYLSALEEPVLLNRVTALLDPVKGPLRDGAERPWGYYDHVLAMFGHGHFEGRFRFSSQGRLIRRAS